MGRRSKMADTDNRRKYTHFRDSGVDLPVKDIESALDTLIDAMRADYSGFMAIALPYLQGKGIELTGESNE